MIPGPPFYLVMQEICEFIHISFHNCLDIVHWNDIVLCFWPFNDMILMFFNDTSVFF